MPASVYYGVRVPLSPSQCWLFERDLLDPQNYNNAYLYRLPAAIEESSLRVAMAGLASRHDAFRLRFIQTPNGWQQYQEQDDRLVRIDVVDLDTASDDECLQQILSRAIHFRKKLNLACGPLLYAVLFRDLKSDINWLLIIASHLNHDALSWPIVMSQIGADLFGSTQSVHKRCIEPKTTFAGCSKALVDFAASGAEEELSYWRSRFDHGRAQPLSTDKCTKPWSNTYANMAVETIGLSEELSRSLSCWNPRLLHTQVGSAILASACFALATYTDTDGCYLDLTLHGRNSILANYKPVEAVGFFALTCPFLFRFDRRATSRQIVASTVGQISTIPTGGIGYNALRYLSPDREVRALFSGQPNACVKFNFVDRTTRLSEKSEKLIIREPMPLAGVIHPQNQRRYLLNIESRATTRGVWISVKYCTMAYHATTIKAILNQMTQFLQHL